MSRYYYRTAFQWLNDGRGDYWGVPHAQSVIDLRSLPQQSQQGGTSGLCVCVSDQPPSVVGSDYDLLGIGNWHDVKVNKRLLDSLPKPTKHYRHQGDDLVGVIRDLLIGAADPSGDTFARPLMPTVSGAMEIHLGQSHSERFKWGDKETSKIKDVLRSDFQSAFNDVQAGKSKPGHHQRVLDYWCDKFGVNDWKEFVPQSLQNDVPGRLKHETTITDNFTRADGTTIGNLLTWTKVSGVWDTVSNQIRQSTTAGLKSVRAESDLSSSDHYGQCLLATFTGTIQSGPAARFSPSAETYYLANPYAGDNKLYLGKIVAGTATYLGNTTLTISAPETIKVECNGSTIKGYQAGTQRLSVTDSSIPGNLRGGMTAYYASGTLPLLDDFQAADLAMSGIIFTQLERSTRGIKRGMYTRFGGG